MITLLLLCSACQVNDNCVMILQGWGEAHYVSIHREAGKVVKVTADSDESALPYSRGLAKVGDGDWRLKTARRPSALSPNGIVRLAPTAKGASNK